MKENIKAPRHWPLCGSSPVTGEFPAQMASNAENVFSCWRLMTAIDVIDERGLSKLYIMEWYLIMKTSSNGTFPALQAFCAGSSPVTGEFPAQRPVTRSFDAFFHLRLNKRLSKQSWRWWFETSQRPVTRSFEVFFDRRLNKQLSKQWRRRWFETSLRPLWRLCNDIAKPLVLLLRGNWSFYTLGWFSEYMKAFNLNFKVKVNEPKTIGILAPVSVLLFRISWFSLERATRNRTDKLVIDTQTHGQAEADAGNNNIRRPKPASGNDNKWIDK